MTGALQAGVGQSTLSGVGTQHRWWHFSISLKDAESLEELAEQGRSVSTRSSLLLQEVESDSLRECDLSQIRTTKWSPRMGRKLRAHRRNTCGRHPWKQLERRLRTAVCLRRWLSPCLFLWGNTKEEAGVLCTGSWLTSLRRRRHSERPHLVNKAAQHYLGSLRTEKWLSRAWKIAFAC